MANEYASIPEPTADSQSLLASVSALKQTVEALVGQRGTSASTAVTQADLTAQSNLAGVTPAVALANLGLPTTGSAAFFQVANNLSEGTAATMRTSLGLVIPTNVREKLAADRTYFVRTDGLDSNTGLVDSAGGAFLTLPGAFNTISTSVDFGGRTVTIQVRDGTYTAGLSFTAWTGGGTLVVLGNVATPANCIVDTTGVCFNTGTGVVLPGTLTIRGFKIGGSSSPSYGILHQGCGYIVCNAVNFGACSTVHAAATSSFAVINFNAAYTISGGAVIHWQANIGGAIQAAASQTITLIGTPAFTQFAQADTLSVIYCPTLTFSGAATGTRYNCNAVSVINTAGGGATYLPGSIGGSTGSGGVYL